MRVICDVHQLHGDVYSVKVTTVLRYQKIVPGYITWPVHIGVADSLAGLVFAGPIISADAACDHAMLQFYSLGCIALPCSHAIRSVPS